MPYIGKQPANVPVTADDIPDNSITSAKILDGVINIVDIANDAVTEDKLANSINTAIAANTDKTTNSTNASDLSSGTLPMARLSGTLPALDGSALTGVATDTSTIENNIAMLGFYRATDHSKAKYNLVDQVIDDYNDATGIDAGASTNESLESGKYQGAVPGTVTTAFSYTGSNQTWTAPTGVTSAIVKLWGAGGSGGSRYNGSISGRAGGGGGYIGATVAVVAGTAYSFLIGESTISVDGVSASPHTNSYGGGANGGGKTSQRLGGTGGGRSEFSIGGGANVPAGTRILVAGGGGGGAGIYSDTDDGDENSSDGGGGAGGGTTGGSGRGSGTPPTGGTQSAGGAKGVQLTSGAGQTMVDGAAGLGGGAQGSNAAVDTNYSAGGGGGGGYYGGGGGSSSGGTQLGHGGGGGSSYANGSLTSSVTNTQGSYGPIGSTGGAVANAGDANYPGGSVGVGGDGVLARPSTGTEGGDGAGVIIFAGSMIAGSNLTLQSTASTASTAPTTGDIVMLIEDASGTATLNTDIKAYVSRNGGSTFTQGTLIEEGTWGTNKKILAFHNLDISGQSSGTDIRYKITTHNQSASKVTNIHATSLAWA